jgi:hypothetical protein
MNKPKDPDRRVDIDELIEGAYQHGDKRYVTCLAIVKELLEDRKFTPADLAMLRSLIEILLTVGTTISLKDLELIENKQRLIVGACSIKHGEVPHIDIDDEGNPTLEYKQIPKIHVELMRQAAATLADEITRREAGTNDKLLEKLVALTQAIPKPVPEEAN